ncbi:fructose-6-phosphate aldolase [bacterium]|nr:fructose-6-phosphate aldolase [bacterium]
MEIYLDTAIVDEIKEIQEWGLVRGVTTNPSLIAQTGRDYKDAVMEVLSLVDGPVSVETLSDNAAEIVSQGEEYATWGDLVVVKVATTVEGLKAISQLRALGIPTNATLIFSLNQSILAAEAGANYISPFVGRLDDIGGDGIGLVAESVDYVEENDLDCDVISASLRHPQHLEDSAKVGAHIATCPPSLLKKALKHPLSDIGLAAFFSDWRKASRNVRGLEE